MTRDIAIRFNQTFGEVFIVPKPDIEKTTQLVPGIDGQKMSKSYGNTIPIFGLEKNIRKQFPLLISLKKIRKNNSTADFIAKTFCDILPHISGSEKKVPKSL